MRVITASFDKTARVWDAATGQALAVLRGHTDAVTGAQFSSDGMQIVTVSKDQTARMWNAVAGQELAVHTGGAGTREAGLAVVRSTLQRWGVPLDGVSLLDGSGLLGYEGQPGNQGGLAVHSNEC